jgi:serine protease Do
MKKYLLTKVALAGVALLSASVGFAQKEQANKNQKDVQQIIINSKGNPEEELLTLINQKLKEQQIIINRKGNLEDKTVIEITGDKVKINGKDVSNTKDENVTVRINKIRDLNALRSPDERTWNLNLNDKGFLFNADSNRAMLGVLTEGNDKGAEIKSVNKESAAEKAGLKTGDIILKIGDKKIASAEDVAGEVRQHKPGEKIQITILRDGREQKVTAELGRWQGIQMNIESFKMMDPQMFHHLPVPPEMPFNFKGEFYGGAPKLGLSIQDTEEGKGVKVVDVDENSNAAKAGIKENDVITHINDEAVSSVDEATRKIRESKDKSSVMLKLQRNGKTQNIEVHLPRNLKTADL